MWATSSLWYLIHCQSPIVRGVAAGRPVAFPLPHCQSPVVRGAAGWLARRVRSSMPSVARCQRCCRLVGPSRPPCRGCCMLVSCSGMLWSFRGSPSLRGRKERLLIIMLLSVPMTKCFCRKEGEIDEEEGRAVGRKERLMKRREEMGGCL
ncbi:hypothetical protein B296_00058262 [Ensete ventricosum]|uniref:Uncharacterized protein n=1 Tax=Ensete ventricosum TaxID=4639 RepID=A0A426XN27_ENSVE|nr:hypothetical protein B296_00058262 [Ensete ventricosum]